MKNNDLNHDWMHGLYRLPTSQRQQIISDQFSLYHTSGIFITHFFSKMLFFY